MKQRPSGYASGVRGRLGVWWRAVRPFSLTASATPVLVGTAVAHHNGHFQPGLFLVTFVASVAIQAATNLVNDYYDYARAVDTPESLGPSGVIRLGLLAPRAVLIGGMTLFALAGLLGLYLVAARGWPILAVGVLSVLVGYAYTAGPLPLGYIGLGDLTVFIFMGPVIVLGADYVQAGMLSATAAWASVPIAALVTAILVVNNLRDIEEDRQKGKSTLATILGPRGSRMEYFILLLAAYLSVAVGVVLRLLPPLGLIAFLTFPQAFFAWRVVRDETDPLRLTRGGLRATARIHQRFGLLLAIALLLP